MRLNLVISRQPAQLLPWFFTGCAGLAVLYLIWGPFPVGEPGQPGFGFRWGILDYHETRYTIVQGELNHAALAGAYQRASANSPPGERVLFCGTPFVEYTYEERGGFNRPKVAVSIALTLVGFAGFWLVVRRI